MWRLYERFPGALPSALKLEDVADLTRPFQAGAVYRLMQQAEQDTSKLDADQRKLIEPLIKEVRKRAKQARADARKKKKA